MEMKLQIPMFTNNPEWVPPDELPDLSAAKEIAIDVETRDPNLKNKGPGWPTKDGEVIGYAVATSFWSGYLPVKHFGGGNLDENIVKRWLKKVLANNADKIMHNAQYDLGWLRAEGFDVNGRVIDTMVTANLLDENRFSYSLNALGYDYLGKVKSEKGLIQAARDFGVDPKSEMWKLPAMYVGQYAEMDAVLTLELWTHFKTLIQQENVQDIWALETALLPHLVEMTRRGIRVDLDRAERSKQEVMKREKALLHEIKQMTGASIEIWAAASISKAFDKLDIPYPRTEKGAPSFTKTFLTDHKHPLAQALAGARSYNKINGTFIDGILRYVGRDGRVHGHINQIRSDDGGTVSGRMCVHGDTVLVLDSGPVRIGEYNPSGIDRIRSHTGEWCRVVRRYDKGVEDMVRLTTSNGASVTCTRGHRVLTSRGWVPVGDLTMGEEVYGVSEQVSAERRRALQGSDAILSVGGQADYSGSVETLSAVPTYSAGNGESGIVRGGARARADTAAVPLQARGQEPDDWEAGGPAPLVLRRGDGWKRIQACLETGLVYGPEGFEIRLRAPSGVLQSGGFDRTSEGLCDTSHRRGPYEQPHRELGAGYVCGASSFAQRVTVEKIEPVGKARVWDIEVEGDHSYVAGGLIHHNSYNSPNLQQIPSRDPILGPMIRSLFLPDEGKQWASIDFSQQEPRLAVHYADAYGRSVNQALTGVSELVEAFNVDPATDFHTMVAEMTGLPRKQAKTVGLGILYGMGATKLADQMDVSPDQAKSILKQFNTTLPFLKQLNSGVQRRLEDPRSSGSIRSILGRKCRFDKWEPATFGMNKSLPYEEAVAAYGPTTRLQRAMTYKALNRLIQASAADMTKKAMLDCAESGHLPMVQIHDELAFSVETVDEAHKLSGIMSSAVPLCVPNKCDIDIGPSWGEAVEVA